MGESVDRKMNFIDPKVGNDTVETKKKKQHRKEKKNGLRVVLFFSFFVLQVLNSLCVHVWCPRVSEPLWHVSHLFSSSYCRS